MARALLVAQMVGPRCSPWDAPFARVRLDQDVFGLANAALFEEFKTVIMGPCTGAPKVERNVAVSEIDFSSCEPCTPSYRPLPDYYMRHTCSERTEEEKQVSVRAVALTHPSTHHTPTHPLPAHPSYPYPPLSAP